MTGLNDSNKYIINPVPEGSSPLEALTHVWMKGTRGPDHIRAWRIKIDREFPELSDAIKAVIGDIPTVLSQTPDERAAARQRLLDQLARRDVR